MDRIHNNRRTRALEPEKIFANKAESYARYISLFFYPEGLQAFFATAGWLRAGLRIMDAGCGTGVVTLSLLKAMSQSGLDVECVNAFDLTPAMLELFSSLLQQQGQHKVELCQANVLELEKLPVHWNSYDIIVSASMLEYIPKDRFVDTVINLTARLKPGGKFILFITSNNWLTKILVENPWGGHRYTRDELRILFSQTGLANVGFNKFPLKYGWLNLWGHIVEADRL